MVAFEHPLALLLLAVPAAMIVWLVLTRGTRGGGLHAAALLRVSVLVVAVLAVSGPQMGVEQEGVNVLYLVDVSESTSPRDERELERMIEESATHRAPRDTAGILSFAATAEVEQFPAAGELRFSLRATHERSRSNLERALYASLSVFPSGGENRIVLISDGQQTDGTAVDAARALNRAGLEVHTVPMGSRDSSRAEVAVRRLIAPAETRVQEPHELRLVLYARRSTTARVQIFRDGEYWGGDEVELQAGDNVVRYTGRLDDTGLHTYRARVNADQDTIPENNQAGAVVSVSGPPQVLYVHGQGGPSRSFTNALSAQGIELDSRQPGQLPTELTSLADYASIVFDNVAAYDLSLAAMENIERYVRDLGRGFVMLGGDRSFGAGGYYQTPIERVLPVDMDVTSSMQIPSLAMAFVIDKSGSMGNSSGEGATKLDIVKQAVLASVRLMNPFYEVGLLAFDADYEWAVDMRRAGNRERIEQDLADLSSGGGTVLGPALEAAFNTLRGREAAVRHIVLLSDGLTSDEKFEELTERIRRSGVTVSTVAVGGNADRMLMERIAEWGGGRSYRTDSIRSVPRIFTAETNLVSRNLIVEEPFVPQQEAESAVLGGLESERFPILDGFVLTYPKADAQEVLSAVQGNPLLATRQYGLGRSVVFTSDLRGRWSEEWLQWEEFPQFAGQLVRWTQPAGEQRELELRVDQHDGQAALTVDARDAGGRFLNGLSLQARMVGPEGTTEETALTQRAPGRYEGVLQTAGEGHYLVTVAGEGASDGEGASAGEGAVAPTTGGFYVGYSPEYDVGANNTATLRDTARAGGGRLLSPAELANYSALYEPDGRTASKLVPLTLPLLAAALLLFLADLVVTYIVRPARAANAASAHGPDAGSSAAGGHGTAPRGTRGGPAQGGATGAGARETAPGSAPAREAAEQDDTREGADESDTSQTGTWEMSYEEARRTVVESYRDETRRSKQVTPEWYRADPENEVAARKIYRKGRRRLGTSSDSSADGGGSSDQKGSSGGSGDGNDWDNA
jgi:Mg-chelatase subunit ChlD